MYYNKKLFRKLGLDPDRPPKTWDELLAYSKKCTQYDKNGNFLTIGFVPNWGNWWLYLYGWQNGGQFMSEDGKTCMLNEPSILDALTWMVKFYDSFKGIENINAFGSTFQGGQYDAFFTEKIGMKIDGNWYLKTIALYMPDMDFGVAPAPVPKGRQFITWSGGFSLAIPYGSKHPDLAWEYIKFATSIEGWLIYTKREVEVAKTRNLPFVPLLTANHRADEMIFKTYAPEQQNLKAGLKQFLDLMPYSKYRPVTPVGQKLWDEQVRAFDMAVNHKLTPKEALDRGTREVQDKLDKIINKPKYEPINWVYVIIFAVTVLLVIISLMYREGTKMVQETKMIKSEIRAGILFASPWILGFLIFTAGPIITSLVLSFSEYDVLHAPSYIGLKNYTDLLTQDTVFWKSLYNTFYLTVFSVPFGIIVALGLSMLLNTNVKGLSIFRTIFFIPSIMPAVASSILWIWILHPEFGLINAFINTVTKMVGKRSVVKTVVDNNGLMGCRREYSVLVSRVK